MKPVSYSMGSWIHIFEAQILKDALMRHSTGYTDEISYVGQYFDCYA